MKVKIWEDIEIPIINALVANEYAIREQPHSK